jgi:hypothetical protein
VHNILRHGNVYVRNGVSMSEEKEFMCTVRGEPCECDKQGCIVKQKEPLERIADALEEVAYQLRVQNGAV